MFGKWKKKVKLFKKKKNLMSLIFGFKSETFRFQFFYMYVCSIINYTEGKFENTFPL